MTLICPSIIIFSLFCSWTPLMVARSWHRHWLEGILSRRPEGRPLILPSPYLSLPLMSMVKIARWVWRIFCSGFRESMYPTSKYHVLDFQQFLHSLLSLDYSNFSYWIHSTRSSKTIMLNNIQVNLLCWTI